MIDRQLMASKWCDAFRTGHGSGRQVRGGKGSSHSADLLQYWVKILRGCGLGRKINLTPSLLGAISEHEEATTKASQFLGKLFVVIHTVVGR